MFFSRLRRNESGELERRRREGRTGGRAEAQLFLIDFRITEKYSIVLCYVGGERPLCGV